MVWVKGELLDDFAAAERLGDGQLDRASQKSLFDRLSWVKQVWHHTPPGQNLLIARAFKEGASSWLFLAVPEKRRAVALANWYNFHFHPVTNAGASVADQRLMLIAMARRLKNQLGRITLAPMREAEAAQMLSTFSKSGWHGAIRQTSTRWSAHVSGKTFAEYWAARPGELRSTFKRKASKSGVHCEIHTRFGDDVWDAYQEVYRQSWKPDEGSFPFLRAMAESEAAAGCLRMGIARLGERPVAAQLWTVENGIALIHKLAYTEDAKEISAGTTLSEAMFRHAIDTDKVDEIDFGTGDDGYKAHWMDTSEPLMELRLFNPARIDGLLGLVKLKLAQLAGR